MVVKRPAPVDKAIKAKPPVATNDPKIRPNTEVIKRPKIKAIRKVPNKEGESLLAGFCA